MNKDFTRLQLSLLFLINLILASIWGTAGAVSAAYDPVAYWPLDDGTGVIARDLSGHNYTGILAKESVWLDSQLSFDGKRDYVDVGALDVTGGNITLTAWFRSDNLSNCSFNDCRIISKANGTHNNAHYWMLSTVRVGNSTRLRFRLKTNNVTTTLTANSGNIKEGEWVHVAAVYDGKQMRLYQDGIEVGSRPKRGLITTNPAAPVWIGGNPPNATSHPWQGQIRDVQIYNQALTDKAIQTTALSLISKVGDYALFFDRFMGNTFYLAKLEGLTGDNPPLIDPIAINLQGFVGQLGNPDVSFDGKTVVFAALVEDDWNIYQGDLDVVNATIKHIEPLADDPFVREEDPRISWDGIEVVYKCDGNVCIADLDSPGSGIVVISDPCELYGPAFDVTATIIAYTRRCSTGRDDRVVVRDIITGSEFELDNAGDGPDRFPHFLADGRLLYSHLVWGDTASLWQYNPSDPLDYPSLFHSRTISDDDFYAHKQNAELMFFIGFNPDYGLYDLYLYQDITGESTQISAGQPMRGTVIFRRDGL